ncbi:MAG: hypothetical protein WC313_00870 [Candidatus Kapaibacterium sp.]
MMPSKLTAQDTYDPTYCNEGDTTTWNGPVTVIGVRLPLSFVACTDTNCIVTVKFYERNIPGWGYEFQIVEIGFQNCDSSCMTQPWKIAMWLITVVRQQEMLLYNNNDCYSNFVYKVATCWQLNPILHTYYPCGGECCYGLYMICRRFSPSGEYFEFNQIYAIDRETYNCLGPNCNFTDCESTMPEDFDGPYATPNGNIGVFYPKMSIYESAPSKFMSINPNPADSKIELNLDLENPGAYSVTVMDINGVVHYNQVVALGSNGNIKIELDITSIPIGLYNVIATDSSGNVIKGQFVKIQ